MDFLQSLKPIDLFIVLILAGGVFAGFTQGLIRYALNAAGGSDQLDGPPFHEISNAVPFLFDGDALALAAARIERLAA